MVKFPLVSPGYEAMVDDCDVEKLSKHPWYVLVKRNKSITPYAWGDVDGRRVYMHRFLLDFPDQEIDHIDGNGLNNQRSNLRLSTRALNMANTGPRAGLYKGVTKRNRPGKPKSRLMASSDISDHSQHQKKPLYLTIRWPWRCGVNPPT